jgi:cytosine/uracil/thiamine/allantoin permease
MIVARVIITALVLINGWMGGEWHIGYSVAQRSVLSDGENALVFSPISYR